MMNKNKMFSERGVKIFEGSKYGKINKFVKKSKMDMMKSKLDQSETMPDSKLIQDGNIYIIYFIHIFEKKNYLINQYAKCEIKKLNFYSLLR